VKRRITLSIDPAVSRRAKKLAHARQTSVSALVEQFLRSVPHGGR
jgi:predicted HicB family RNase H-like nuclease